MLRLVVIAHSIYTQTVAVACSNAKVKTPMQLQVLQRTGVDIKK